jgi:low temperature requirement protein LtrA
MLRFGRDSRSAQPWLRPPRLRTLADVEEERHASWLELFFDLVFVVAIAELSHELVVNHTLNGFATFAALFVPVFVAWQGFSLQSRLGTCCLGLPSPHAPKGAEWWV